MKPRRRSFKWNLFLLLLLGAALPPTIKLSLFAYSAYQPESTQAIFIAVAKGENPNDITKTLMSSGILANAKDFIWLGRITRQWRKIKAGEYKVSPAMAPIEIFTIITSGISAAHPITVREGENLYEISDELAERGLVATSQFIHLSQDPQFIATFPEFSDRPPQSLEGYYFPDTYYFNRTLTAPEMARQMVKQFFTYWGKSQADRAEQLRMTRHEVITLASMIEKETGAPEERAIISSVFHNRLKKQMKLQSDPTTIYGMWSRYQGKIHRSDLLAKNEYNTYAIKALPIGPIGNPGREAISAALYPSETPYLYFVSHNDGTHQFSQTFEEHNAAVRKFQLDPKARQGKSWRDHLKKPASVTH
jgi:UPF0755 protein